MPLEAPLAPITDRVASLNTRYRHHAAIAVLSRALNDPEIGRVALVSSFGAESVVLLHLMSIMDRSVPVIFVDTRLLFKETLEYQVDVANALGLTDVRIVRADAGTVQAVDPYGSLRLKDADLCCNLRKTAPLHEALREFDGWITGRKRYQSDSRAEIDFFENEDDKRIKINPLAHWHRDDLIAYIENNTLPRHPLVAKGFASIGCAPCTSAVSVGEDARAGRWRGQDKVECGIHSRNHAAATSRPSEGLRP